MATSVFVEAHMASMERNQKLSAIRNAVVICLKFAGIAGETQYILQVIQVD